MAYKVERFYTDPVHHEWQLDGDQVAADRDAAIDDAQMACGIEKCQLAGWLNGYDTLVVRCPSMEMPNERTAIIREKLCQVRHEGIRQLIEGMAEVNRNDHAQAEALQST